MDVFRRVAGQIATVGLPLSAVTLTAVAPRAPVGTRKSRTRYRLGRMDRIIVL